ncbi:DUF1810 domain-containing protein [Microbulbifer agarilyticus]|uniref:DUF1810 domain-containing protein n=1 Tax=Microbulbifer agarilyticus TaxID=260552 RepID=UPI001E5EDF93|nr:DUF1810 domain-containing protein [Microbulbifer agarilyticus]
MRAGNKRTHWMWFIFPQIDGLGRSSTARHYAIKSLAEAKAYLAHPVLGTRLRECCDALLAVKGRSAHQIFGSPDDMKLQSSMTLFASADGQNSQFNQVLIRYFSGELDSATLKLLDQN